MMHANYYGVFLGQWGFLSTWYRAHRNKRDIPISSGTAGVYFVSLTPRSVSKVEIKSPSWSRNFLAVFTRKKLFATIVSSQVTNQSDAYKTSKPTIIFHLIVSPMTVNCGVERSGVELPVLCWQSFGCITLGDVSTPHFSSFWENARLKFAAGSSDEICWYFVQICDVKITQSTPGLKNIEWLSLLCFTQLQTLYISWHSMLHKC